MVAATLNCKAVPPKPQEAAAAPPPTGKMSSLMISEWMAATPLTAKLPTTAR